MIIQSSLRSAIRRSMSLFTVTPLWFFICIGTYAKEVVACSSMVLSCFMYVVFRPVCENDIHEEIRGLRSAYLLFSLSHASSFVARKVNMFEPQIGHVPRAAGRPLSVVSRCAF
jgi:hypothetical protein